MEQPFMGGRRKLSAISGATARKLSSNRKISRTDRVVREIFHTKVKEPPSSPVEKLQQQQQQQLGGLPMLKHSSIPFNVSLHPFWPFMHLGDNITARWDGLPMPKQPTLLDGDDVGTLLTSQLNEEDEAKTGMNCPQKVLKFIKIMVPHVVLVAVLIGAVILQALETRTELMVRSRKLVRLGQLIENFTESSWHLLVQQFAADGKMRREQWDGIFRDYMISIAAEVDDRRPIRQEMLAPEQLANIHNKWTFPTALLYVLTVLTTCGYSEVSVNTDLGKIFSVIFALVGIPLMFITAADIGKFLSDPILWLKKNWRRIIKKIKRMFIEFFCIHKIGTKYRRKSIQSMTASMGALDMLETMDQIEEPTNLWFPIGAYVLCICVYCSMGSFMFMNWEDKWSFIHSFHFGFNLIVTVGLGDVVVTDYIFLSLIVAFVIVGLAVVTMCVDLASTHLKAYFTSLHYFGRAKRFLGMSEELREIVTLLGVLRRKKHGKITWDDVCNFLENELYNRPFEPHDLLMKLRFIDENTLSSALSTVRHNSFQSDFLRDADYLRRLRALRPDQPAYL
ncbi:Uncoordinated protein 58 [Globodera pallida]|nr:Uncoordinated protein 58 [Globodera pallida]